MNGLIMSTGKGLRFDLTAQMKDTDEIVAAFMAYDIIFDKKYTSLNTGGPSTITFKGVKTRGPAVKLTALVEDLYGRAKRDEIGNVFLQAIKEFVPAKKEEKSKPASEPETAYTDIQRYNPLPGIINEKDLEIDDPTL